MASDDYLHSGTELRGKPLSDTQTERARRYRREGMPWSTIGARLGVSPERLRYWIDPGYAEHRRKRTNANRRRAYWAEPRQFGARVSAGHVSPQDLASAVANVPVDTRSRMARFMGDPLPGRSALDAKRNSRFSPVST